VITNDKERLAHVQTLCKERNVRFTAVRQQVMQLIFSSRRPLKAYDILLRLNAADKPPVVYRALNFLIKHGFVHKINSQSAYIGCSHPEKRHASCYLLICNSCGATQECCSEGLRQSLTQVAHNKKFELQRVCVEIHGCCSTCRA